MGLRDICVTFRNVFVLSKIREGDQVQFGSAFSEEEMSSADVTSRDGQVTQRLDVRMAPLLKVFVVQGCLDHDCDCERGISRSSC